jgi:hypothetical protein
MHPSAPTASLSNRVTHVELGVASAHASSSLKSLSYAGIGLYEYKHNALRRTDDVCFPFKRFSYLRNLSMRNKSVLSSSPLVWQPPMVHSLPWISWQQNFYRVGLSTPRPTATWRTRPPYLWPPETGWPSYTPRHWVPIWVVSYDTHELRWDCCYTPVTTRRKLVLCGV